MRKKLFDPFTSASLIRNSLFAILTFFLIYEYHSSMVSNYTPTFIQGAPHVLVMLYNVITFRGSMFIPWILVIILGTIIAYDKEVGALYYMISFSKRRGTIYLKRILNDVLAIVIVSIISSILAFVISYPSVTLYNPIYPFIAALYFIVKTIGYLLSAYLISFCIALITFSMPIALLLSVTLVYFIYMSRPLHVFGLSIGVPEALLAKILNFMGHGHVLINYPNISFSNFLPLILWAIMICIIFIVGELRDVP